MHDVICHFGDMIRLHGPLGPWSTQGLEAKHVPIKRRSKYRTNRHGFGTKGTTAQNSDVMQVARYDAFADQVRSTMPAGRSQAKKVSTKQELAPAVFRAMRAAQFDALDKMGLIEFDPAASSDDEDYV